jgi:hypothetical protein
MYQNKMKIINGENRNVENGNEMAKMWQWRKQWRQRRMASES